MAHYGKGERGGMSAGESAGERARRIRSNAEELRRKAEQAEKAAELWSRGESGERQAVGLLASLAVDGYFTLSDRRRPGSDANLDCVVVGPSGVVVVDAKNWSGEITVVGSTLRQNGYSRNNQVDGLREATGEVVNLLRGVLRGTPIPVWPVMCFVGEASIGSRKAVGHVQLVDGAQLPQFVRSLPAALDSHAVDTVMSHLLQTLPPRSGINPHPALVEPDETVVFLHPWKKAGRHRLYVKDSEGYEVGHLDLVARQIECKEPVWRDVLERLLPHYGDGGKTQPSEESASSEPRGIARRVLGSLLGRPTPSPALPLQPLIVGRYWHNSGKHRLYVDRLDESGAKTSMGWYGLDDQYCHSDDPTVRGVIAFCGSRFKSFSKPDS